MRCCRRPSAPAAATPAAVPTPQAIAAGSAHHSTSARPVAGRPSPHSQPCWIVRLLPLNPVNGMEGPLLVALIDEEACIGCAKCLPPCPVDAIIGAQRQMHTVVAALCTGCELCVAPCPVDCIRMVPRASTLTVRGGSSHAAGESRGAFTRIPRAPRSAPVSASALLNERKQAARADAPAG